MVSLYIVRHGQTEFNLDRKIQGWCDSPLTELGINQAKSVGLGLKDIDFVGCACSDKQRTRDKIFLASMRIKTALLLIKTTR